MPDAARRFSLPFAYHSSALQADNAKQAAEASQARLVQLQERCAAEEARLAALQVRQRVGHRRPTTQRVAVRRQRCELDSACTTQARASFMVRFALLPPSHQAAVAEQRRSFDGQVGALLELGQQVGATVLSSGSCSATSSKA